MRGLVSEENAMRVLIVEPSGNMWGSERVLLDFLQNAPLVPAWEFGVCCPPATPILKPLSRLPVQVFQTFAVNLHLTSRARRLLTTARLLKTARRFKPQLIYVNQAGATRIALAVGRLLRVPIVTHVRLVEDVAYIQSLRADTAALPKVICISNYIYHLFVNAPGICHKQVVMMYDPYSPQSAWQKLPSTGADSAPDPVVSCVGRLARIKGQDVLLQAVAALKRDGLMLRALFIGAAGSNDSSGDDLRRLASDLEIADRVEWLGYQEEVIPRTARCVAQVCPSHSEPLGRVIFEAWDAGTVPIAWSGSGGSAEIIEASGGGLLYDRQAGDSLAATLKKAISLTPVERATLIQKGRTWLQAHCDTREFTSRMLALWREALDRR